MRSLFCLVTALMVIALAFWAYRENHLTQEAMSTRASLQREIARLDAAIAVQRVEWAYLNRPDRLRALVDVNFDSLQLVPLTADHFARIDEIAYPVPATRLQVGDGVEVVGAPLTLSDDLPTGPQEQP